MDEEHAREIARAYAAVAPGHVWEERVFLAARGLIPDGAKWAIRAAEHEILASDGRALYRLRDQTDLGGDDGTITAERVEVKAACVRETAIGSQEKPPKTRNREWKFELEGEGEEPLTLTTTEKLGPGQSPDAREELARRLARAAGWSI